jgi:hypothetical protein
LASRSGACQRGYTLESKRAGKTKADFFREEQKALKPFQPGLFDDLPES